MNFKEALCSVFSKYATFSGRARRAEYWYFCLLLGIVNVALQLLAHASGDGSPNGTVIGILVVFSLAMFLPSLAVSARRLHDTDRSGWWILISFVPIVGLILLFWLCTRGTAGTNRYGDDPLA